MKAAATAGSPAQLPPIREAPPSAEARSSTACSSETSLPAESWAPSAPAEPLRGGGGDETGGLARRCSFCINLVFYSFLAVCIAFAGILYGLPPSHWVHGEARRLLAALPASSLSPEGFRTGPLLRDAAQLLRERGLGNLAGPLASLSEWEHLDVAVVAAFSCLAVVFVAALVGGMLAYRREREVEVNPPAVSYCQNRMTLEEYRKKNGTYAAIKELMATPEFQELRAKRAGQGSEAWNWQRRAEAETMTDDEEEEDEEGEAANNNNKNKNQPEGPEGEEASE